MVDLTERGRLVRSEARRAKVTQALLALCGVSGAATGLASLAFVVHPVTAGAEPTLPEALGMLAFGLAMLGWVAALIATMVAYLVWLHGAHRAAEALEIGPLPNTPSGAVLTFFIPFLNLVRPYQAVRALYEKLDPSDLPAPEVALRPSSEMVGGYRENAAAPQAEIPTPAAPLNTWWGFWLVSNFAFNLTGHNGEGNELSAEACTAWLIATVLTCVAAERCFRVVRAVDARVRERDRRLALRAIA